MKPVFGMLSSIVASAFFSLAPQTVFADTVVPSQTTSNVESNRATLSTGKNGSLENELPKHTVTKSGTSQRSTRRYDSGNSPNGVLVKRSHDEIHAQSISFDGQTGVYVARGSPGNPVTVVIHQSSASEPQKNELVEKP